MANQDLSKVTTVPTASINNVKTFLAVMKDGSIQQMSKADMASVLGELLSKAKYTIFRTRKGEDVDTGISIGAGYFAVAYVSEDKPNWSMSDIWKVTKNSTEFKSSIEKVVQSANDVNAKRGNDVDYVSKIVVTQNTWENADMAIMQLVQ